MSQSTYFLDEALAARERNSAKTSAKTIPVLTPISVSARLKYSVVFSFSMVRDAPTLIWNI